MSYNIDFVNNKEYGADDINKIRSTIMTKGIIKKSDDDCLVTLLADGIHINSGEALFQDGCRIEVTDTHIIPHTGDCYVYFDRNYYGIPEIKTGEAVPDDGVPLARITGGNAQDLRPFATLKIPTMAPNRYLSKELPLDFSTTQDFKDRQELVFEDRTSIRYITIMHQLGRCHTKVFIDFERDEVFGVCGDGRVSSIFNMITLYDLGITLKPKVIGNRIIFDIESNGKLDYTSATVTAM